LLDFIFDSPFKVEFVIANACDRHQRAAHYSTRFRWSPFVWVVMISVRSCSIPTALIVSHI